MSSDPEPTGGRQTCPICNTKDYSEDRERMLGFLRWQVPLAWAFIAVSAWGYARPGVANGWLFPFGIGVVFTVTLGLMVLWWVIR